MSGILERALREGAPLIDGENVTFVWQGSNAPSLIADFTDWLNHPVSLIRGAQDVWSYTLKLPPDAYMEYAFLDTGTGKRTPDPFNVSKISNGYGETNSYFYMPEARPSDLIRRHRGVARGVVTRHAIPTQSMISGEQRTIHLYRLPVAQPCPLLVVLDGSDYLRRGKIVQTVDNLIHQGRIRPLALALVANGGLARWAEYACSESSLVFLKDEVLTFACQHLDLVDHACHPGAHAVMGASMGGLMSLFACLRLPEIFGSALCQSSVFRLGGYLSVVVDLIQNTPPGRLKIWMDAGKFETIHLINREIASLLDKRGYDVRYHEHPGGHNFTSWRNELWRGLEHLFPT